MTNDDKLAPAASFACAVWHSVVLVVLFFAGLGADASAEKVAVALYMHVWVGPIATLAVFWGLQIHSSTRLVLLWVTGCSLLIAASTLAFWFLSSEALAALDGRRRAEGGVFAMLLMPFAYALAGLGAAALGFKLASTLNTSRWHGVIGLVIAVLSLATYISIFALLAAVLLLVVWWVQLGQLLREHSSTQATTCPD